MSDSGEDQDRDREKLHELKSLFADDKCQEAYKVGRSLKELIDDYLQNVRPGVVKELEDLKEAVERSYNKSRKARIAGTTATVTGLIIAIAAFGLGFFPLHTILIASLVFTAIAVVLAAAGGLTICGAEIGYFVVSRNKLKEAEKACHKNNELFQEIKERGEKYSNPIESLSKRHTTVPTLITCTEFYGGFIYRLIDGVADVGTFIIIVITNTVRGVLQARAQTVYFGLGTFGRAFSIGSVALDVLFIPIIMVILVKSAYDVHKYKNGYGKSNSVAAKNIRSILEKMEEHEEQLIKFRDHQLPGAPAEIDQDDKNK